ncbi:HD domain protein [Citrifermentans bremense]|uniref:HD family phosphohydrolase n=2 Tax=Geobacteraceae TaxID=213422 RepID=A0ABQ0MNA7_9BACT|nr:MULTISPECIES: HDOD domain-containing protein [Geobacteraceae]BCG48957.1 HD domain protein [Citrifermentans bremense]GAW68561.1 hD family phosphohydrolase [Geoanaerobacter pelophilus]
MNKELETAIMSAADLPTIPIVAIKVMQLIESDSATADELAKIVSSDPAVAARVLKISNSSFYGCRRQIQTLSSAIVILGFSTLRSLVVAASVKQVYKPYGLTEKMLWEHSFAAGLAARIIANRTRIANEEEAFLAGLFHDIGKIIMNTLDRNKFQEVMQHCYNEGISFGQAERSVYPFSHAEVGAHVIRKWNFPEILTSAILHHHTLEFDEFEDPTVVNLTAITALANLFCLKLGIGIREPEEDIDLGSSKPAQMLKIGPETAQQLLETFDKAFQEDKALFIS